MNISGESLGTFLARQTVQAATPLVMAGLGELVAELTGVINIGIEGLMLMGCIAGYAAAGISGSGQMGLAAAILTAMGTAAIFAGVTIWAAADQIVAGAAVNILAVGASGLAWFFYQTTRQAAHQSVSLGPQVGFQSVALPGLSRVPFFGPVLFDQYMLFYAAVILALVVWLLVHHTRTGAILRALGDAPEACQAAGISVRTWRTAAVLFAGACAGAAGAYLSIMRTHAFASDMTGGQGFVVLSLVIFGRWTIPGLVAGCLLFGGINSLQQTLQTTRYTSHSTFMHALQHIPFEFFQMLPYVVALLALATLSRSSPGPRYLGQAWKQ